MLLQSIVQDSNCNNNPSSARPCCQSLWRSGPSSLSSSASAGSRAQLQALLSHELPCAISLRSSTPQTSSNYPASPIFGDQRPCEHKSKLFVAASLLINILPLCLKCRRTVQDMSSRLEFQDKSTEATSSATFRLKCASNTLIILCAQLPSKHLLWRKNQFVCVLI